MRTLLFTLAAGLGLAACANQHIGAPLAPPPAAVENDYRILTDQVFTPINWPQKLFADLYVPQMQVPARGYPAVVLIHGGAWARGDREQVESLARRIARRGYVVMSVTHRFAPDNLFPAQIEDVQQALRWLQQSARRQQVDVTRIAAWGYSSGAHLAAMLANLSPGDAHYANSPRIQALVAGGAPMDLRKFSSGYLVPRFLGTTYKTKPALFAEASPVVYVSRDDPPAFLYHGSADRLVDVEHSIEYKAALDAVGIRNELFLIAGMGHFTAFFADGEAVEAGIAFLDRQLLK